jgi:integrase
MAFWNFAQRLYDIPANPVRKVPGYPIERPIQYTPPESDVAAVIQAAEGEVRVWLMCYLLTGAREQEVNRLKWSDVDLSGRRICLWSRKNARHVLEPQWIPMAETLANILRQWRQHTPYGDNILVLPSPMTGKEATRRRRLLEVLCDKAGVKRFPFHAMRRYVGSILVKNGEPLRHVQLILRHGSLAHTERYIQGLAIDLSKTMANLDLLTTADTTPLKIVK